MTSFTDLPNHLIERIITTPCISIRDYHSIALTDKLFHNIILQGYNEWVQGKFKPYFHLSTNVICYAKRAINFIVLEEVTQRLLQVSQMPRRVKYQHLLVKIYNSDLFFPISNSGNNQEDLHTIQATACSVLTSLSNYTKMLLSKNKTNLEPWAMYPLFDYIAISMQVKDQISSSIFETDADYKFVIYNKALQVREELRATKDCTVDIKFRLRRLLDYIIDATHPS